LRVASEEARHPAEVASIEFKAMMDGDGGVVAGWQNKLQAAIAKVAPTAVMAKVHANMAAPGTAKK
jgi:hypothetical protein